MGLRVRYNPDAEGLQAILGSLEQNILEFLWDCDSPGCTNKRIQRELRKRDCDRMLTTITTTTRRMAEKGLLREFPERPHYGGRPTFVYSPAVSRSELIECTIERVLGHLLHSWPDYLETYLGESIRQVGVQ